MQISRPTWVEINLENLKYNINQIKKVVGYNVVLGAVLKANAYGHGIVEVAKAIEDTEVGYIFVATLSEALELRDNNIKVPILVMGYIQYEFIEIAIKNNITLTVFENNQAEKISCIASKIGKVCKIHLKIDTGFNRIGFKFKKENIDINNIYKIFNLENIQVEGIFSHLALTNKEEDYKQYNRFIDIVKKIEKYRVIPIKHICDSIAMCRYKQFHMDMVRVGAGIYGYTSIDSNLMLKQVMTFKSKIIQVKDIDIGEGISYDFTFRANRKMKIGIVPCGYGDGIPRELSNRGYVIINGKRADIIGKICMDYSFIDLTNLREDDYNKDIIFYGENGPDLSDVASLANTNKNEILSRVSKRVYRLYL